MISIAVIGTSNITEQFIASCKLTKRFSFEAVYSRNKDKGENFATKYQFKKVYTDLIEMANDSTICAVYIASPNSLHYEQSKLFLEHGKHVFCEKPIVTNLREYIELKQLADKNNLIYLEAIMSLNSDSRLILKKAMSQIGKIAMVRIDFCQYSSKYQSFLQGNHVNVFDRKFHGGALMDLGVYCVYAVIDLFGIPQSVMSSASFLDNGVDKSGITIFKYHSFDVVLSYSKVGQSQIKSEIIGEEGTIKIGSISQYNEISLIKENKEQLLFHQPEKTKIMKDEANNFANFIEDYKQYEMKYKELSKYSYLVCQYLDEIKRCAQIEYD